MLFKKKIVVTGGSGRFAQSLKKIKSKYKFIYPQKKSLDITKVKSIKNFLKKQRPESVLHLAGLSRPMSIHNKNISRSIDLNIIGTANLVKVCSELKIKLIYFSTSYVYPGKKVTTMRKMRFYLGTIMDGQNLGGSLLCKCMKIL